MRLRAGVQSSEEQHQPGRGKPFVRLMLRDAASPPQCCKEGLFSRPGERSSAWPRHGLHQRVCLVPRGHAAAFLERQVWAGCSWGAPRSRGAPPLPVTEPCSRSPVRFFGFFWVGVCIPVKSTVGNSSVQAPPFPSDEFEASRPRFTLLLVMIRLITKAVPSALLCRGHAGALLGTAPRRLPLFSPPPGQGAEAGVASAADPWCPHLKLGLEAQGKGWEWKGDPGRAGARRGKALPGWRWQWGIFWGDGGGEVRSHRLASPSSSGGRSPSWIGNTNPLFRPRVPVRQVGSRRAGCTCCDLPWEPCQGTARAVSCV